MACCLHPQDSMRVPLLEVQGPSLSSNTIFSGPNEREGSYRIFTFKFWLVLSKHAPLYQGLGCFEGSRYRLSDRLLEATHSWKLAGTHLINLCQLVMKKKFRFVFTSLITCEVCLKKNIRATYFWMELVIMKMISNVIQFLFSCKKTNRFRERRECLVICVAFVMRIGRPKGEWKGKQANSWQVGSEMGEKPQQGWKCTVWSCCAPSLGPQQAPSIWQAVMEAERPGGHSSPSSRKDTLVVRKVSGVIDTVIPLKDLKTSRFKNNNPRGK